MARGASSKQSKPASTKLMRCPVIAHDIKEKLPRSRFPTSLNEDLICILVLYAPSVLEIPLPYISLGLFYICQIIILTARRPRSAPLLAPPGHMRRLIGFVPVSSPLSVLSLLSDALLPIWKLVTPHITQLRLRSISLSNAPAQRDRSRGLLRRHWTGIFYNHILPVQTFFRSTEYPLLINIVYSFFFNTVSRPPYAKPIAKPVFT